MVERLTKHSSYNTQYVPLPTLDLIDTRKYSQLQNLVIELFKRAAFKNVEATKKRPSEYGADVIIDDHCMKAAIQIRGSQYAATGTDAITKVLIARDYYKTDFAIVVSSSFFSENTYFLAKKLGVTLIDKDKLSYWINILNKGASYAT